MKLLSDSDFLFATFVEQDAHFKSASLIFLEKFPLLRLRVIRVDEELETKAWGIFKRQTRKGTSFVDCANLAVIRHFKLDGILSFDRFYPAKIRLSAS